MRFATTLPAAFCLSLTACAGSLQLTPSDHATVLSSHTIEAANPAEPGPYDVGYLTYGSGTDRRRPEYRDSVAFRTESVDASKLVELGDAAKERNGYWGFTPEEFPINGRVWFPEGEGPFPLALIVHGNHDPTDFSDPGYDYLGELLASRGIILVSVDMNFINGGIREENDGRGWLLLKHLEAWRGFVADGENPFFEKADMDRIALMGHSRGGEAVGHAAAFNTLDRYPDDASLEFDFDFGVRSIVAIAPVDGQYLPTGRLVPVENVDYMVLHGSHDGDVTSFHGLRLYQRLAFTDGDPHFKTAIYMYRANHGQWNTVWRNKDFGPRSGRILELGGLIDTEDQLEMGRVYISAFLEVTLKDNEEYLPLFRDHRVAGEWLPETMYVTRFETSGFRPLAGFDEDIDVTTGTAEGVTITGDSLGTWRENLLALRSRNRPNTSNSQGTNAVWLGWNNAVEGQDEPAEVPASYALHLPEGLATDWSLSAGTTLDLLLAALDEAPGPREGPGGDDEDAGAAKTGEADDEADDETDGEDDPNDEAVDLSIRVTDAHGGTASVPLSDYGPIRKPLEIRVRRRNDADEFGQQWELVLQSYSIPLADFEGVDPGSLREVRLVFDLTDAGTVVVDEIGLSNLDPAFLAAERPDTP
ncbi:MAG: hypothetical protein R3195_10775 [Gemmatimonadota bacterium]|nr:hypothetical protein [Gemmatimonadota bacterium]